MSGSPYIPDPPSERMPAAPAPGHWRGPAALLAGVAGVALVLALESLGAATIVDVTLRFPGIDKAAHVVQYALVFTVLWWLASHVTALRAHRTAIAAGLALLLGTSDELIQGGVADRTFEAADLAANGFGVLLGIGVGSGLPSRRLAWSAAAAGLAGAVALAGHSYLGLRHFNRGLLYTRAGDMPKALEQYRLARDGGMDSPAFYNELAWIEVESGVGDVQAAVVYGSRALHSDPTNPDILDTYGWALHRAGRSREAISYLERALAAKPRMYCIHYHLGEVYAALGDRARAERHLRLQIARFPGSRESRQAEAALRRRALSVPADTPAAPPPAIASGP